MGGDMPRVDWRRIHVDHKSFCVHDRRGGTRARKQNQFFLYDDDDDDRDGPDEKENTEQRKISKKIK